MPNDEFTPKKGLNNTILQVLILALFFSIALRLWYFQIYKGSEFADKAKDNVQRKQYIYAPRGMLRDRNNILLAENKPAYALAIVREDCRDIHRTLEKISQWTQIPVEKLRKKYEQDKSKVKSFQSQLLITNLHFSDLARIEPYVLDWPGIRIVTHPLRYYPQGEVLSHVVGYVAQANEQELRNNPEMHLGDNIGKQGLEFSQENRLRGKKGIKQVKVDAQGRKLKQKILKPPVPGEDLQLTIDAKLQKYVWDNMGDQCGSVVVLKPFSGQVLALVSKPGYDNNSFVQGVQAKTWEKMLNDPQDPLQNRAIQSAYPPGSVFKLVITASALERQIISPQEKLFCPGSYRLGRRTFKCWKEGGHGWMNMHEAIKQSCDVYFYKLGEQLGVEAISNFANHYGFNQHTGIRLPFENKGLIPDKQWKYRSLGRKWQGGDTINMSIGQGYTLVTPIQIARYVAALINGGYLLRPCLIQSEKPEVQASLPLTKQQRQIIIKAMLAAVEEPHGTAWRLRSEKASIGGKTGTAQVVKLLADQKDKDIQEIPYKFRDHAWMASFGCQGKDCYVVVAMVEHGGHGSSAAGPIVKAVYDYLFLS